MSDPFERRYAKFSTISALLATFMTPFNDSINEYLFYNSFNRRYTDYYKVIDIYLKQKFKKGSSIGATHQQASLGRIFFYLVDDIIKLYVVK